MARAERQKIKIFIDPYGNTLNMWWGDPDDAYLSDETKDSNDILIRNKKGEYIGLEKVVFFSPEMNPMKLLSKKKDFLLESKSF